MDDNTTIKWPAYKTRTLVHGLNGSQDWQTNNSFWPEGWSYSLGIGSGPSVWQGSIRHLAEEFYRRYAHIDTNTGNYTGPAVSFGARLAKDIFFGVPQLPNIKPLPLPTLVDAMPNCEFHGYSIDSRTDEEYVFQSTLFTPEEKKEFQSELERLKAENK
ncbi:hypothetical protein J4211_03120 [Candidatus Woesearchaeota archaeon]|nr:hypothetical protein [Candidatus Woesearchaeota archaeon]